MAKLLSKEEYKKILKGYLRENKPNLYDRMKRENELQDVLEMRVERFMEQMEMSEHPDLELEVYFQEMLEF